MLKVKNMTSDKSGREVANQFIIEDTEKNIVTFQSYDSCIVEVEWDAKRIVVHPNWDYSRTTGKYRNKFMRDMYLGGMASKKDFEDALNNGVYGVWEVIKAS